MVVCHLAILTLPLLAALVAARFSWVDFANFPSFRGLDSCAAQCLYCNGSVICESARISVDLHLGCLWDACICGAASNERDAVEYIQTCVPSSCPSTAADAIDVMHQYCSQSTFNNTSNFTSISNSTQVGPGSTTNIESPTGDPTVEPTNSLPPVGPPSSSSSRTTPLHPAIAGVTFSSLAVCALIWLLNLCFFIYRRRLGRNSPGAQMSWLLRLPKKEGA